MQQSINEVPMRIAILTLAVAMFVAACGVEHAPTPANEAADSVEQKRIDPCEAVVPQEGRNEPRYVGMVGYLGIPSYDLDGGGIPKEPWQVQTLEQTGPRLWSPVGRKVSAKTKVTVISQSLSHQGYGRYDGILTVRFDDGTTSAIQPKNFIPTRWWECPIHQASRYSAVIAMTSPGSRPVGPEGNWIELRHSIRVICRGSLQSYRIKAGDEAICEPMNGKYKGVRLAFDQSTLKTLY